MTIIATVYNCGYEFEGGKFTPMPYLAVLSDAGREQPFPRLMSSSDLPALRQRLKQFGLSRHPPDPRDPSVILEVWL
jgi:hypothetical protein